MADEKLIVYLIFSMFLLFLSIISTVKCSANDEKHRVNVIVIGTTGDLARRYLWQGFFDLYLTIRDRDPKTTLRLYGAAREINEKGNSILENILRNSVKCSQQDCEIMKGEYFKLCRYLRLKVAKDYEELQGILEGNLEENEVEIGRLFYLSVPPFTYDNISRYIHSKCRPKNKDVWLRVVLEKPFGSDFKTAQELAEKLSKFCDEEEIYRIDHYLGKSGVQQITEFRSKNRFTYEKIWNRDFIEQVNIVVKEKDDVAERMRFYDHYGVIRDVFQNHLTEILILVASELPENDSGKTASNTTKTELLKSLRIASFDALFGQYQEYNTQLRMSGHDVKHSNTATFSAVLMQVDNKRWFGVPFVMVSGKNLDRRLAYVQIQFKRTAFCIGSDLKNRRSNCQPKDIIFYIQGDEFNSPVTAISKSLPKVNLPDGWRNLDVDINTTTSTFQGDKVFIKPPLANGAYSCLIREVFLGNKKMFVGVHDLLLSWKIWTPLLEMSTVLSLRLYTPKRIEELDFEIVKGKLKFISEKNNDKCKTLSSTTYTWGRSHSFRGNRLISGPLMDVVQELANDIVAEAQMKVRFGGTFHLALSGGTTPKRLYHMLAYAMDGFPWQQTHIWFVDERCVALSHDQSNFRGIYESLLKHVNVPYVNIHAMPVDIAGRWCRKEDESASMYEQLLEYHTGNGSLDFVVLGVGNDGHTASLFPHQAALKSSKWVELAGGDKDFHQQRSVLSRMTLTLPVLNKAKHVAVLILGETKMEIVNKLSKGVVDVDSLPITGVRPVNGSLSWYIDDDALVNT